MKQDTFLILKLSITFIKELFVGQGSFSAKCTGLFAVSISIQRGICDGSIVFIEN